MTRQDFMAECWRQATSILEENPSVVGSSMYCWNSSNLLTIARLIKAQQPDVTVVAGGPDTYGEGAALLGRNPALDVVLGGEGEVAFLRFLEAVLDGSSMADVPFATYRSGDQIVTSDKVDYIADLDNIPSAILGHPKMKWEPGWGGKKMARPSWKPREGARSTAHFASIRATMTAACAITA